VFSGKQKSAKKSINSKNGLALQTKDMGNPIKHKRTESFESLVLLDITFFFFSKRKLAPATEKVMTRRWFCWQWVMASGKCSTENVTDDSH
jgi:hypothetical protein